ncbi:MAG: 30S ribosomal protein S12 methylthiotransferase RimO [candidate division WOR-3 bacterium]
MIRIHFISLGCPKNLVDSEKLIGRLLATKRVVVSSFVQSDVVIINTCGFIAPAIKETTREITRVLRFANGKKVYVLGCAVNRMKQVLSRKFKGVAGWFSLTQTDELFRTITNRKNIPDTRILSTSGFSYLKIADGCSNHCSYCTIPMIKGEYKSVEFNELINEARELAKLGIREIILIAQDTTRYGLDLYKRVMFVPLIREISKIPDIEWIRIMYAHPKGMTDEIISEIANNPKVCKYLDLPIQHINDRILERMNRGISRLEIESLIKRLKSIKNMVLRTTVMVGFPGETDQEFYELKEFLKESYFDWFGVFSYSCEPETAAASLKQLPKEVIRRRYKEIVKIQRRLVSSHLKRYIGGIYKTLVHSKNGNYLGHTEFLAPEIDPQIVINNSKLICGKFYTFRIEGLQGSDLCADLC